ncbi:MULTISPECIES: nucleotide synthetase [Sphingomonadaceae]|uniref:nucleotide synthetase n=1 Tax=Sphingomonadaceae TaxID=41297 RepID=UPI001156ECF4|nr:MULTISPECIES: nucleotide synthetase [Sphingomonadaceae]QDK33513.1 hypothetical protein DM450_12185 [Sphingomonas sp. IC081]QSR17786.1 hypothetical protein CA833_11395 [Novosphingobium sp. KA1]
MSTLDYTQYGLAPWLVTEDKTEDWNATAPIVFNVVLGTNGQSVVLEYQLPDYPDQDYISVTCNSTIQINLVSDQLFFSKEFEGITTKEPLSSFYGGVEYCNYDKEFGRYKTVLFKARFNKGGKLGTCHRFNVNVDLLQYTSAGEPTWIGLAIDPDIKNPPPQD